MNQPPKPAGGLRAQFGLAGLLMLMFIASAMGAAGFYLVQSLSAESFGFGEYTSGKPETSGKFVFILITLAGPMLLMVLISLIAGVIVWIRRR